MDPDHEPFLPAKENRQDKSISSTQSSGFLPRCNAWRSGALVHTILISLYTIISITVIRASQDNRLLRPTPAIDDLDIEYTRTIFHNLSRSPYAGVPSPALDAAWNTLLSPMHIRVSEAELRRDNQESVALIEGGGHLGWMGVFHELHCINMLRKWNHREYYHASLEAKEIEHLSSHVDHCTELLRQTILCHADASLTTFKWHLAKSRPMFNASESIHTCVDWQRLMESVRERVVDEEEILRLQNPLMKGSGSRGKEESEG